MSATCRLHLTTHRLMLEKLPAARPSISDIFRRRRVSSLSCTKPLFCFEFHFGDTQVQEVAAHLNVHLPSQEGEDSGALTSRRKPPPPSSKTNLAAITLKNHPLSLPPAPPKPTPPHQNQIVVDDFGAPAPPPPEADEFDGGAGAGGGMRRPQAARRGVAGSLGGRKIVER